MEKGQVVTSGRVRILEETDFEKNIMEIVEG
jgi:hypothetical protein